MDEERTKPEPDSIINRFELTITAEAEVIKAADVQPYTEE